MQTEASLDQAIVDPDDHERLVARARLDERSVSAELRVAIREHLGIPSETTSRAPGERVRHH